MLVGERMSHPVITVNPDMPIQEALNLMQKEHVRRFPVVDKRGRLKGIVSEKDLLNASPSDLSPKFQKDGRLSEKKINGDVRTMLTKGISSI